MGDIDPLEFEVDSATGAIQAWRGPYGWIVLDRSEVVALLTAIDKASDTLTDDPAECWACLETVRGLCAEHAQIARDEAAADAADAEREAGR